MYRTSPYDRKLRQLAVSLLPGNHEEELVNYCNIAIELVTE